MEKEQHGFSITLKRTRNYLTKHADYTVFQYSTDVGVEEHAKRSVKPGDVISYFQSPYLFGNKEGFRRSQINEIGYEHDGYPFLRTTAGDYLN